LVDDRTTDELVDKIRVWIIDLVARDRCTLYRFGGVAIRDDVKRDDPSVGLARQAPDFLNHGWLVVEIPGRTGLSTKWMIGRQKCNDLTA
jgi:hypothetical protein